LAVYEPTSSSEEYYTICRSKPTIITKRKEDFIVYPVIDTPFVSGQRFVAGTEEEEESSVVRSRVIAVTMDGTRKWEVQLVGAVQGDVVVGKNGGKFLYVAHNIDNVGYLSVIMVNNDTQSASVVATITSPSGAPNGPFGPPAVRQVVDGQQQQQGDVVLVAESWGQGFVEGDGSLYMLTTTSEFAGSGGVGNESYEIQRISSFPLSSIVEPLVDGNSVYLGFSGGIVAGWTGNERNDLSGILSGGVSEIDPRWVYEGERNGRNASQRKFGSPFPHLCFIRIGRIVECTLTQP
jgi:hypothetical protein